MPKKKNLHLSQLKVKSFVTQLGDDALKVKGGSDLICKTYGSECVATCEYTCGCGITETCATYCGTCGTDCGTCFTCDNCNYTIERTCGPECTMQTCF